MSFNVNGMDITSSIVQLEFQVAELRELLQWQIANGAPNPGQADLEAIGKSALAEIRQKYPKANIDWTPAKGL